MSSRVYRTTDSAKAAVDTAREDEEWNAHLCAGLPLTLAGLAVAGAGAGSLGFGGYAGIGSNGQRCCGEQGRDGFSVMAASCMAEWLRRYALFA
jgi:hypothetical protein